VVVKAAEATSPVVGGLRPMNPTRDLKAIADLVAEAFADEIDRRGRAALREMRWMARLSPLVWWWAQADPDFQESFNGFVWEEPRPRGRGTQVVGNVSLSRAPGDRQWWVIANVVVEAEHRGRGIGQRLVQAAIDEARELGARGTILQVYEGNLRALRLYIDLGFREAGGEVDLWREAVPTVAFLDAPGYHLRPWQTADGESAYELARRATPAALQWLRPLRPEAYRLDGLSRFAERLSDLVAGRHTYRLMAWRDEQLAAMLTVIAAFRRGEHRLALLVHPDHMGRVEAALVSRALYLLGAMLHWPVQATISVENAEALKVLDDYGFERRRALLTLRRDF
jgi:ribosomal protein S18 acetylase RimI-like enzyme